ncbi:MAG: LysR family transcriptional regulator [Methylotenera sp.]|nr:LysR family transcriptional regulator [Methylotenera sp.]
MKIKIEPAIPVSDTFGLYSSQPHLDWTDFYTVFMVAQQGSVAKACISLAMTHSTLLRKLDLIETRLKARLFERVRGNYTLTPAGDEIMQAARTFEPIARAAELRVLGQDLQPSGEVRISVASIVIEHLLPPVLIRLSLDYPEIQIELTASPDNVSLRRREADVAIRMVDTVPDWLVGRKIADVQFKVYTLRQEGVNPMLSPVNKLVSERRWIGFERYVRDLKVDRWLTEEVPEESVVLRVDNFTHALTMVRAGIGIALLPTFLETREPYLQPLTKPIAMLNTPLWLVTHPELRNVARIQAAMYTFASALKEAMPATNVS